jgi:uncharacterized protein DUF4129
VPAIDIDRTAAHQAAQQELAKPIYPRPSASQRFHEWLNELLDRLMQSGASVPGGWLSIVVLLILLALAVAVGIRVARRTLRTSRGTGYPLFDGGQLSAAQHRATAEQYAAQGDWAAAIRQRLRAVARALEESGVLDPVPGRTAGELAQDAGNRLPHLVTQFSRAAAVFNDVTYGEEPGEVAGYRLITELDDQLRSRPPAVGSWAQVK